MRSRRRLLQPLRTITHVPVSQHSLRRNRPASLVPDLAGLREVGKLPRLSRLGLEATISNCDGGVACAFVQADGGFEAEVCQEERVRTGRVLFCPKSSRTKGNADVQACWEKRNQLGNALSYADHADFSEWARRPLAQVCLPKWPATVS